MRLLAAQPSPDLIRRFEAAEGAGATPPSWLPTPDHTPAYLRTSAQMLDAMRTLEATYPNLVQLVDIGDSALKSLGRGGHDIWLLRLTAKKANQNRKPTVTHVAGMHAREVANPELLLQWGTKLLEGYGHDAQATALLETRIIDLVPLVNPDGHDIVTDGFANGRDARIWQRKNANPSGNVDLNRNFRWNWNGFGTSRDPSNDTYRGPSPASEPETQALQALMEKSRTNMFVDWHSFSGLNLYPWGDSFLRAPDDVALAALANRFTQLNGYVAQRSTDLYPTSGTSIDHAYGVHHIAAIGVETGDNFHPLEAEFADIQRRNEPVLADSALLADAPFDRVLGPRVSDVQLATDGTLTAHVSDAQTGAEAIRRVEWVTTPAIAPGSGVPMGAVDGAWDGATELARGTFDPSAVKPRPGELASRLVYVRAQDVEGHWGPATPQWITPPA
jgi:hypothetical protein